MHGNNISMKLYDKFYASSQTIKMDHLVLFISILFFSTIHSTNAGTSTGVFNVVARVQSGCAVDSVNSLDFGDITLTPGQDIDAQGAINFNSCSGTLQFSIDGGQSGNTSDRSMKNGGNLLRYQLYRNPTRTSIWGQGTDAREIVLLTPGSGSVTVYGRISRGQEVPNGIYTDTLAITLSF